MVDKKLGLAGAPLSRRDGGQQDQVGAIARGMRSARTFFLVVKLSCYIS